MKRLLACLALALVPALGLAQKKAVPLVIQGDTVVVVKSLPCKVAAQVQADFYLWSFPESVQASETADGVLEITRAPKGTFRVKVVTAKFDFDQKKVIKDSGYIDVNYGGTPDPTPPVPPDPPVPPPDPAPIPVEGFRVLIVEDIKGRDKLPPAQLAVLFDKKVRDYLQAKCVTESDQKTRAWRIWPQDVDCTGEQKLWQDAMKRKRAQVPWIVISDGKKGYEGPLPENVEKTLDLLMKYGGQ